MTFERTELPLEMIKASHNYAVGVPIERTCEFLTPGTTFTIIVTYPEKEQLEREYNTWRKWAEKSGMTTPVPLEKIERDNWKILEDIISKFITPKLK